MILFLIKLLVIKAFIL